MSKIDKEGSPDWLLLFFLFLFTNQANLSFKILGLIFIFICRFNFDFRLSKGRIPLFYVIMPVYSLFVFLFITRDFSLNYLAAFTFGNMYWIFGLLAFHQLRLSLEKYGVSGVHSTIKAFTVLNVLLSSYQLLHIMIITEKLNPYADLDFPYGMSTGDNISGFFLSNSYYNMMISAMLVVYFIFNRNLIYALLATYSLVLVFGNIGTVVFVAIIAVLYCLGLASNFMYIGGKWLRNISPPATFAWQTPLVIIFLSLFYIFLSPENMRYLVNKIEDKVFAISNEDKNSYATIISNQTADPEAYNIYKDRSASEKKESGGEINIPAARVLDGGSLEYKKQITMDHLNMLKGKSLSIVETIQFLKSSVTNCLFGAGTGRFSSLTAQKFAGYDSSRLFLNILPRYSSSLYEENHKLIIDGRYKSESTYFSNANWPDSFYNFIFSEYGIIGFLLFVGTYAWYFFKKVRYMSYSIWIAIMLLPFANLTYLFEALSIIPLFELLLMADIQRGEEALKPDVL